MWCSSDNDKDDGGGGGGGGADDVGVGGGDNDDEVHLVANQSREESRVGVRRKRRVYVLPLQTNNSQFLLYYQIKIKFMKSALFPQPPS